MSHVFLAAPLKFIRCCRMGIANRDLKLENTLLDRRGPDALLKICDFGYSINENTSMPRSAVGTPGYTGEGLRLHACHSAMAPLGPQVGAAAGQACRIEHEQDRVIFSGAHAAGAGCMHGTINASAFYLKPVKAPAHILALRRVARAA